MKGKKKKGKKQKDKWKDAKKKVKDIRSNPTEMRRMYDRLMDQFQINLLEQDLLAEMSSLIKLKRDMQSFLTEDEEVLLNIDENKKSETGKKVEEEESQIFVADTIDLDVRQSVSYDEFSSILKTTMLSKTLLFNNPIKSNQLSSDMKFIDIDQKEQLSKMDIYFICTCLDNSAKSMERCFYAKLEQGFEYHLARYIEVITSNSLPSVATKKKGKKEKKSEEQCKKCGMKTPSALQIYENNKVSLVSGKRMISLPRLVGMKIKSSDIIYIELRHIHFEFNVNSPLHYNLLINRHVTVGSLLHFLVTHLQLATTNIYIFADKTNIDRSTFDPSVTFADYDMLSSLQSSLDQRSVSIHSGFSENSQHIKKNYERLKATKFLMELINGVSSIQIINSCKQYFPSSSASTTSTTTTTITSSNVIGKKSNCLFPFISHYLLYYDYDVHEPIDEDYLDDT
ncbi:hypothetical protein SNEBB_007306 [Seison nebaliae]|nr:hypothetical protein SNEBB_007306 [Seison nebaliae]